MSDPWLKEVVEKLEAHPHQVYAEEFENIMARLPEKKRRPAGVYWKWGIAVAFVGWCWMCFQFLNPGADEDDGKAAIIAEGQIKDVVKRTDQADPRLLANEIAIDKSERAIHSGEDPSSDRTIADLTNSNISMELDVLPMRNPISGIAARSQRNGLPEDASSMLHPYPPLPSKFFSVFERPAPLLLGLDIEKGTATMSNDTWYFSARISAFNAYVNFSPRRGDEIHFLTGQASFDRMQHQEIAFGFGTNSDVGWALHTVIRRSSYRVSLPFLTPEKGSQSILFQPEANGYQAFIDFDRRILALQGDFVSLGLASNVSVLLHKMVRLNLGAQVNLPFNSINDQIFNSNWHLQLGLDVPLWMREGSALKIVPQIGYQMPFKSTLGSWREWQFGLGLNGCFW